MLVIAGLDLAYYWHHRFSRRVHHGCDPEYLDRNYGGILIIWDRLFGTVTREEHRPTYGLTRQVDTYNPLLLQDGDDVQMVRDARAARRVRDKVGYVVGPPGWEPPADHEDHPVGSGKWTPRCL